MGVGDCSASAVRKLDDKVLNGAKSRPNECRMSTRLTRDASTPSPFLGALMFLASCAIAGDPRNSKQAISSRKRCKERNTRKVLFCCGLKLILGVWCGSV